MKYIVTATEEEGDEEIFIFPASVNHDIMADAIYALKNKSHGAWKRIYRKPVSAGFVEGGKCTGRSETLGLSCRPQDTSLLNFIPKKDS